MSYGERIPARNQHEGDAPLPFDDISHENYCMKTLIITISLALVVTAVSACQSARPTGKGLEDGACGADTMADLIGQPVTAYDASGHSGPVRIIRPGDAVTMDYRADRLNVMLDDQDVITGLACN